MTIKNSLPKFESRVLIVTASKQTAKFYLAHKNKIEEIDSIKIETPIYSDREGFFERTGRGMLYGTGSVYENKDMEIKNRFVHALAKSIKEKIKDPQIASLYLFTPEYMKNSIHRWFSDKVEEKLVFEFHGNYLKTKPFRLLKMISERHDQLKELKTIRPIKEEARKILNSTGKIIPYPRPQ